MRQSDRQSVDQTVSRQAERRGWRSLGTWVLYALPLLTALVIGFAIFVVGAPQSYRAARVWGGPTEGVRDIRLRLHAIERYYEVERPLRRVPVSVEAWAEGRAIAGFRGKTDGAGFTEVVLRMPEPIEHGAVQLRVSSERELLAEGSVELSRTQWLAAARRRGGWIRSRRGSDLEIRVRPGRGVFAVPFSDPVEVEVRDAAGPVAGARVTLRLGGVTEPREPVTLTTNEQGLVSCAITPAEHVVTLTVEAESDRRRARWYSTLPVVPGALHARLTGNVLKLVSPVPRDAAFVSLIDERARLFGARVEFAPAEALTVRADIPLPDGLAGPLWAVVSSEPDMNSPAAVGWPLSDRVSQTLDARDVLLLDGLPQAYEKSRERPRQARLLAALFALFALALAVVLIAARVRAADREIEKHFERFAAKQPRRFLQQRPFFTLLTGLLCVALGFCLVALISLARIE